MADEKSFKDELSICKRFVSASIGSLLHIILLTPLDVVKTRLQSQDHTTHINNAQSCSIGVTRCNIVNQTEMSRPPDAVKNHYLKSSNNEPHYLYKQGLLGQPVFSLKDSIKDNTKNKLTQTTSNSTKSGTTVYTGTMQALIRIPKNEGLRSLWRGLSPTLVMSIPSNAIYFVGYDIIRHKWLPYDFWLTPLISGIVARSAAATVISPIELFRTRLQAAHHNLHPRETFAIVYKDLKNLKNTHGLSKLWQGLPPTLYRDVPFSGLYWLGFENLRSCLANSFGTSRENDFLINFMSGAISGVAASCCTQPFDVIKTYNQVEENSRVCIQDGCPRAGRQVKLSTAKLFGLIFEQQGFQGLFRGLVPRCAKVAPACAIMISSYEIGKDFLK